MQGVHQILGVYICDLVAFYLHLKKKKCSDPKVVPAVLYFWPKMSFGLLHLQGSVGYLWCRTVLATLPSVHTEGLDKSRWRIQIHKGGNQAAKT